MEYKVIESKNLEEFQAEVNSHLLAGWSLQGGVTVAVTEQSQKHYTQALTKTI